MIKCEGALVDKDGVSQLELIVSYELIGTRWEGRILPAVPTGVENWPKTGIQYRLKLVSEEVRIIQIEAVHPGGEDRFAATFVTARKPE